MDQAQHNSIVNFIWGIADDVLRDRYDRSKYRDVILPMTVLRRLDSLLEPTKDAVLKQKRMLDDNGIVDYAPLCIVSKQAFYNTSEFTRKSVESSRFASGDQDLRQSVYDRFGTELYDSFKQVRPLLEEFLNGSSPDEDGGDEEDENGSAPARPKVPEKTKKRLLDPETWERDRRLLRVARQLHEQIGDEVFNDHNLFRERFDAACEQSGIKLSATDKKAIWNAVSWRDPDAEPIVKKKHKDGTVDYEPDTEFRDTEKVPLKESVKVYFDREVAPYVPDAWIDHSKTVIGYEISFTKHFYKYQPLRSLDEIRADILALEAETDGLLKQIVGAQEG